MQAHHWISFVCLLLICCGDTSCDDITFPDNIDTSGFPDRNIAGTYTLTFTAARYCTDLPPRLRERQYTATITQEEIESADDVTTVILSGADFWEHPLQGLLNEFTGTVSGSTLRFKVRDGGWGIVEQVGPTTLLEIIGRSEKGFADTTNPLLIFNSFNGEWRFGEDLRDDARHSRCSTDEEIPPGPGSNHTFKFERQ